jgi:uncharacterized membrane protein
MDAYLIALRIVHIGAAVFWAGSALLFFFFIEPTVKAIGPAGGQFMGHAIGTRKMPMYITAAATLTVLGGALLYWEASAGFDLDWVTSATGLGFTVGAVAAIIAWILGLVVVAPSVKAMGSLGAEIQASGGPPSEAQAAEMERLDRRLKGIGRLDTVLIILAVLTMATARYL